MYILVSSDDINKKLKNKREGNDSGGLKCSKCGTKNTSDSLYCLECGDRLKHTDFDVKSNENTRNAMDKIKTKSINNSFLRKIPGFRSDTPWKMVSISILYLFALIIIITLVSSAFVNNTPSFEVAAGAPITIVNNNSSTNDGNLVINTTMHNTGSNTINVLPVEVYYHGNHIGEFYITNVTPDQNTGFKIRIYSPGSDNDINTIEVTDLNNSALIFGYDNQTNTYSLSPGDYNFVIGNSNANISTNMIINILQPLIDYYKSNNNSSSSDTIPIQGQVAGNYSPSGFTAPAIVPVNQNLTIVMPINSGTSSQGQWTGETSGNTITGYQDYQDVIVIYWPEMKIAGWHRIYGPTIPDNTVVAVGETAIYGNPVNDSTIEQWIASQPKI